jgi:hypothetical protein
MPDRPVTADELIAFHKAHTDLLPDELEAAIPKAIDAVYATRDAGGTMHDAGAAAAVAALEAAREVRNAASGVR